ncbi:MAG: hypothetical protein ACRDUY_05090 [Nitriliruptorales bacterium]
MVRRRIRPPKDFKVTVHGQRLRFKGDLPLSALKLADIDDPAGILDGFTSFLRTAIHPSDADWLEALLPDLGLTELPDVGLKVASRYRLAYRSLGRR